MKEFIFLLMALFAVAVMVSYIFSLLYRRLAIKLNILDRPGGEGHKGHGKATPLMGGAAMFDSLLFLLAAGAVASWFWYDEFYFLRPIYEGMTRVWREILVLGLSALAVVLVGLRDDYKPMKPQYKFLAQILAAIPAVIWGGVRISLFVQSEILTIIFSVFWFLLLFNAFNFFDNMDGLAVGCFAIAMFFFGAVAVFQGQILVASAAVACCAVGIGFWCLNRAPAKIFMGDSGSLLLGFLSGCVSAKTTYFTYDGSLSFFPVLLPVFILAMPIFDAFAVVVIRLKEKKPFWIGDHNHISHRFVKIGLDRSKAVAVVHLLSIIIGLGALPLLNCGVLTAAILTLQLLLLLFLVLFLQIKLR